MKTILWTIIALISTEALAVGFNDGGTRKVEAPRMRRRTSAAAGVSEASTISSAGLATGKSSASRGVASAKDVDDEFTDEFVGSQGDSGRASSARSKTSGNELVRVKGRGVGVDQTEALKDAYRDAVERAVGLYVDSEQMISNDTIVKDQILTHSNAYIEDYSLVSKTQKAGVVQVDILARVRKAELTKRIRDVMPASEMDLSDVNKNLHAQIISSDKLEESAHSLLAAELNGLQPLQQMFKVSLASSKPTVERNVDEPSMVRLWYPVKIEVDQNRYFNDFIPRLVKVLDQIKVSQTRRLDLRNEMPYCNSYLKELKERFGTEAKHVTGIMTRCEEPANSIGTSPLYEYGLALNEEYRGVCFLSGKIGGSDYVFTGFHRAWPVRPLGDDNGNKYRDYKCREVARTFINGTGSCRNVIKYIPEDASVGIGVIRRITGNASSMSGSLYKIPYDCVKEIFRWQGAITGGGDLWSYKPDVRTTVFDIRFLDGNKEEVVGSSLVLRNVDLLNFCCSCLKDCDASGTWDEEPRGGTFIWMVSPLVGGFARTYIKWINVDIQKDDVQKIQSVVIKAQE